MHRRTCICTNLPTDDLHRYSYNSQGRLQSASTGQGSEAPTTKYAHNALGQRVFKTEALYNTSSTLSADDEEEIGFLQSIQQFFTRLWSPKASDAEHLGWSYLYDENASLLGDYGMGGANSGGQGQYFYLPTANGPMPIAAEIDGQLYAIHSDHLNTPRHLTQADGQPAWQWAYSAYGDEAPTLGARRFTNETTKPTTGATGIAPVRFNLRYPGQYFDEETGLHYNYFRSYDPRVGRYSQPDPIGLDGGWNRFSYVGGNPLGAVDPEGLVGWPRNPLDLIPLEGGPGGGGGTVGGPSPFGGGRSGGSGASSGSAGGVRPLPLPLPVLEKCDTDSPCPPCSPYPVGTIGFQGPKTSMFGIDGTRTGSGQEHYILFIVQQNPKNCACRWQESKNIGGHHYYSQPNFFFTVNLNGKGRPPAYP